MQAVSFHSTVTSQCPLQTLTSITIAYILTYEKAALVVYTLLKLKVEGPLTQLTLTVCISRPLSLEFFTSFPIDVTLYRKSG